MRNRDFDPETLRRAFAAIQEAIRPFADGVRSDTPEYRALVKALIQSAEMAHPGPWRAYLADVCGVPEVPARWSSALPQAIRWCWERRADEGR